MNIHYKTPVFSGIKHKIYLFSFIGMGILFVGMSFLGLVAQKNGSAQEEDLILTELAIFNGNTLLPISCPSNPEPKVVKSLSVIVTAYSSTPWETWGDPFITAAGTQVREGIIANNLLPFGTRIKLPELYGDRIFIVEDRMHSKKGYYHVDIWSEFNS